MSHPYINDQNHWRLKMLKHSWVLMMLLMSLLACNLSSRTEDTQTNPTPTPNAALPVLTATAASGAATTGGGAVVGATATPPDEPFFVTITAPLVGAKLPVNGFTVMGLQRGSFENNVVVQIRSSTQQVLAESSTTSTGNPGEIGAWQIRFDVDDALAGQSAQIYAFYSSARDGSEQANAWINVSFTAN
jgi:hypothetical protein